MRFIIGVAVVLIIFLWPAILVGGIVLMLYQRNKGASGWPGALLTLMATSVGVFVFWMWISQTA